MKLHPPDNMLKYSRGKPWTSGDRVPRFSVPPFNNIMYTTLFLTADLNVETIKKQPYLPKCESTLKGGEAVYITLSDLTQIGIFLTAFTVMIFTIISFNKKK